MKVRSNTVSTLLERESVRENKPAPRSSDWHKALLPLHFHALCERRQGEKKNGRSHYFKENLFGMDDVKPYKENQTLQMKLFIVMILLQVYLINIIHFCTSCRQFVASLVSYAFLLHYNTSIFQHLQVSTANLSAVLDAGIFLFHLSPKMLYYVETLRLCRSSE